MVSGGGGRTVLVLGGIRAGRSHFVESLPGAAGARRLTAGTEDDLARLADLLAEAKPDETVVVDPLADWFAGGRRAAAGNSPEAQARLVAAVRSCAARLVLVSAEVGMSLPPATATGKALVTALGATNQALAEVVDEVVLVVAGQPVRLKPAATPPGVGPARPAPAATGPRAIPDRSAETDDATGPDPARLREITGREEAAESAATERIAAGQPDLGELTRVVAFAAGTQDTAAPTGWRQPRLLVLAGDHAGAAAAGAATSTASALAAIRDGSAPLARLAQAADVAWRVVETDDAGPIETGPAMTDDAVERALAAGWRLAESAVDEGTDLLLLGAVGAGAETAAAALTAALAAGEPSALLGWVRAGDGTIDDPAWMRRCAAIRDAVHRVRATNRGTARAALAELGGPDIATATGVILGAAARRTPVLIDGPVGAAAGLVARSLAGHARHWCLLPDSGGHPTVKRAAEVLGLTPLLDLRLQLGEGAAGLVALPMLRTALTLAGPLLAGSAATGPGGPVSAPTG